MVLAIPIRKMYGLEDFITMRHLDNMAKIILATSLIVSYGYAMEAFFAWYGANSFEQYVSLNRMEGPYAPLFWGLMVCNVLAPQFFWIKKNRNNTIILFIISIIVNVGMWLERFVIVITSLHRDYLPSSWDMYYPTIWDWATYFGTIGLFLTLIFLFIRVLPVISIFELRTLVPTPAEGRPAPHPDGAQVGGKKE